MKKHILAGVLCCVAILCVGGFGVYIWQNSRNTSASAQAHYGQTTEQPEQQPDSAVQSEQTDGGKGEQETPNGEDTPVALPQEEEIADAPDNATGNETDSVTDGSADVRKSEDPDVQKCMQEMELLKSRYVEALESMEASARAEYSRLPQEQHTPEKRNEILNAYASELSSMEARCDDSVNALLAGLREKLDAKGESLSAVQQLRSIYVDYKATKKAAYLSELNRMQS